MIQENAGSLTLWCFLWHWKSYKFSWWSGCCWDYL